MKNYLKEKPKNFTSEMGEQKNFMKIYGQNLSTINT